MSLSGGGFFRADMSLLVSVSQVVLPSIASPYVHVRCACQCPPRGGRCFDALRLPPALSHRPPKSSKKMAAAGGEISRFFIRRFALNKRKGSSQELFSQAQNMGTTNVTTRSRCFVDPIRGDRVATANSLTVHPRCA